jgi:RNA polymerase sigma factor (sigma-70 family)
MHTLIAHEHSTEALEDLVQAANAGDQDSWNGIVNRLIPMVTAVIARYRLSPTQADDVNQTVWLRLVEHLADIREPRALPGWLATTARRECLRVIKLRGRETPVDPLGARMTAAIEPAELHEDLLREERAQMLRKALLELSPQRREVLTLLMADPPPSYDQVSAELGIPVGSIGPTRARALAQLRSILTATGHSTC